MMTRIVLFILAGLLLLSGSAYAQNTTPYIAGTSGLTNGHVVTSGATVGQLTDGGAAISAAGSNTFTGTVITTPTTIAASGNVDLSSTGGVCGKPLQYTGASAGTLTVLATATPGCSVPVYPTSTGLATIAAAGSGTIVANAACTTNARTLGVHSVIWVTVQSNAGSAPVINVSGDCG